MKKLSIITICYNEPELEKTCKSIIDQTWQDFEWIVIDGGSKKEILDIFEKYKHRIDKFVSEPDNGIYNACNKGINLARGEYIHFLNAGDMYYNKKVLETIFLNKIENADVIYGEQYETYSNSSKNRITKQPKVTKRFLINNCIQTSAAFIKREMFLKFGLYNEKYKIVSDYEKWIVFYQNGANFKHVKTVVTIFDKNGISSNKKTKELHDKERNEVIEKYFTEEEIYRAKRKYKNFSLLEQIFSITNNYDDEHKVITIIGLHFNLRRKTNE